MEENNTKAPEMTPAQASVSVPATPKKPSRWQGAAEFGKFVFLVVAIVVVVRVFIAQPFIVSGTSMVPTFQDRNYLIVDELTYDFKPPQRGDVIVFHPPIDLSAYYIKRVIGVPGDTVTIKNSVVTITNASHPDGLVLTEPYITPDAPDDNFSVTVPAGQYFVMGDNRPASFDSRKWGLLPAKLITGRVFLRLFPAKEISVFPGQHVTY